ncbi:MAG: prepilin-type N-terminal cleavage/methylation domain-containing protein [Pseudomonadota bacterium]
MKNHCSLRLAYGHKGSTLIEVLVTFFVLAIGLMGLLSLHARLQSSEMEAYQRSQALLVLDEMANRIANNAALAATYVTNTTGIGTGTTCSTGATTQARDAKAWCDALQGAAETLGSDNVGAMLGARGCVENLSNGTYMITVAWQGLTPLSAPPSSVACGRNLYDGASGTACTNDICRRAITTIVRVASL